MKLLIVADKELNNVWGQWSEAVKKQIEGVELVLSAGDLAPAYLEFLVTMLNVPLLYVRGNHDELYHSMPPEGCTDIDGRCVDICGLRIAGLGGSMRYRDGKDMYTEKEMSARIRRLRRSMKRSDLAGRLLGRAGGLRAGAGNRGGNGAGERAGTGNHTGNGAGERAGAPDILLTHAPCYGYGDMEDLPHRGFRCFNELLEEWKPAYHLYGHVHKEYGSMKRLLRHPSGTVLINCCGMYILELD